MESGPNTVPRSPNTSFPNRTILGNVKSVEDVANLFQTMLLLFGIDIVSMIVNSKILSKFTDVSLYEELCRTMKRYWIFVAVRCAATSCIYFGSNDINLGIDPTGEWGWISQEGWLQLIHNTTDLLDEEKAILLSQQI